ncbi:MAG: nucleotidyltransferase domain-containing protein [Gemmatimonadaceae bacterium]
MPPNTADQLAAVAELHDLLEGRGVAYWLFGGWAVDFHAGRVTRAHADLDLAIWRDDGARVAALLGERAWVHTPEAGEDGYTCFGRGDVRLELAYLARDERGHIYTPLRTGRGEWPAHAFGEDVAELLGVRARVIALRALIADKSVDRDDPSTSAKDRADVLSLGHGAERGPAA